MYPDVQQMVAAGPSHVMTDGASPPLTEASIQAAIQQAVRQSVQAELAAQGPLREVGAASAPTSLDERIWTHAMDTLANPNTINHTAAGNTHTHHPTYDSERALVAN